MILLDSTAVSQQKYSGSNNRQTMQYPANGSNSNLSYQQSSQINYSADQNVTSLMNQGNVEMPPVDQPTVSGASLNYAYPQDYQFDVSGSNGIPYSGISGLGNNYQDSMEPLFAPLNPPTDANAASCCDNESILQCVTLGCNSNDLEPKP